MYTKTYLLRHIQINSSNFEQNCLPFTILPPTMRNYWSTLGS